MSSNILMYSEDIHMDSSFNYLWLPEEYRQRTIHIKYLNYLIETQNSMPKELEECNGLKFIN